jgi:hypothetical protein
MQVVSPRVAPMVLTMVKLQEFTEFEMASRDGGVPGTISARTDQVRAARSSSRNNVDYIRNKGVLETGGLRRRFSEACCQ